MSIKMMGAAIAAMMVAAGCTKLDSRPIREIAETDPAGIAYTLPMVAIEGEASWQLAECPSPDAPVVRFEYIVSAKPNSQPDIERTYVLRYDEMASMTKTTRVAVTLHDNGMLKTINAASDDRSAEIATGLVKAGFSAALLAMGLPTGVVSLDVSKVKKTIVVCTDLTIAYLNEATARKSLLKAAARKLNEATLDLAAKQAAVQDGVEPDDATKKAIADARTAVKAGQQALAAARDAYELALVPITVSQEFVMVPSVDPSTRTVLLMPPPESIEALLEEKQVEINVATGSVDRNVDWTLSETRDRLGVGFALGDLKVPTTRTAEAAVDRKGLRYVIPARSNLRACKAKPDWKATCQRKDSLIDMSVEIPQLGRVAVLPLENGIGEDNSLSATFTDTGRLVSVEFAQTSAPLEEAVGVLEKGLKAGLDLREARRGAKLAELNRRIAEVEAETALAEALRVRAGAQGVDQLGVLESKKAIAEAELALLRAERELNDARAE